MNNKQLDSKRFSIAILAPVSMGPQGEVVQGAVNACYLDKRFALYKYFARGVDPIQIARCVEDVLGEGCDLVVTVGLNCAFGVYNAVKNRKVNFPHIIAGVNYLDQMGLVQSLENPGGNATGICYSEMQSVEAIDFLSQSRDLKKLLMAAAARTKDSEIESWFLSEISKVSRLCEERSIEFQARGYSAFDSMYKFVSDEIKNTSAIFLPDGTVSLDLHKEIGQLCSKHGVTLFTGLLEPVKQGTAALGFGASYHSLGVRAIEYAKKILVDGIPAGEIPCHLEELGRRAAINLSVAKQQGLDPEHIKKVCAKWNGIVFGE